MKPSRRVRRRLITLGIGAALALSPWIVNPHPLSLTVALAASVVVLAAGTLGWPWLRPLAVIALVVSYGAALLRGDGALDLTAPFWGLGLWLFLEVPWDRSDLHSEMPLSVPDRVLVGAAGVAVGSIVLSLGSLVPGTGAAFVAASVSVVVAAAILLARRVVALLH